MARMGLWLLLSSNKRDKSGGTKNVMLCSATCPPSGILLSNEAASPRRSFNSPSSADAHGGVLTEGTVHRLESRRSVSRKLSFPVEKKVCVCVCVSRASILTLQVLEESLCGAGAGQGGERGCADLGRTALCRITASG